MNEVNPVFLGAALSDVESAQKAINVRIKRKEVARVRVSMGTS
jgi:hypothetical protein